MLPSHTRVLGDILACRTPELGGSLFVCDQDCGHLEFSYHSCRNRHCSKCHRELLALDPAVPPNPLKPAASRGRAAAPPSALSRMP